MMRTTENLDKTSATLNPNRTPPGRYIYLEAFLQGGAPWGFTLKGGLEHGEPLIISKIEEGGKADSVSSKLRAGDEVVHINEVALSSSRREAVSLVKGSYKTLRLVVRRDACAAPDSADPGVPNSGPEHRKAAWAGGVKLRLKHRRSDPTGRPHSWHSAKLGENQPEAMMQISQGTIGTPWPQGYHSSSSASDLSSYDHAYLRHSPDPCSSQGSMESLEPSGGYPACHLLSPAKSTSSIDQLGHLHSKRDSAYSSFSTSSSILEYPPPGTAAARERSGSMDTVSARGGLLEGMRHADVRYVKTVYDPRRGVSAEYEVNSSALHAQGREARATADGQPYDKWAGGAPRSKGVPPPSWSQQQGPGASEAAGDHLPPKVGAPLPPARSDSFAAFRHRERPNSWSSLEHKRFCRPPAPSSGLKAAFLEEQLHTVVEKSPESSPPAKPRHGYAHRAQPGQPLLPTGIYPVPSPEPHFAHVPPPSGSANGTLYPALAKESGYAAPPRDKLAALDEHGAPNGAGRPGFAFYQPLEPNSLPAPEERKPEAAAKYVPYKVHFPSVPENEEDASPERPAAPRGERRAPGHSPYSGHHALRSPPAGAWQLADDQRPPWEGPGPEDPDAHPPRRPAREGPAQSPPGHLGGGASSSSSSSRPAFSSLQNIPDSLRRLSCPEAGDGAREAGRKAGAELRSHPDGPVSYPRPEGRAGPLAAFPSAEPGCEEPSGPGRRQPQRAVLEKVSRIEQREQGQRGPAVGPQYRPQRALGAAGAAGSDLDDAAEPGAEDAAATRQPARREPPPRPAGRLLRSVSTFQLCGDDEPPAPDAPFSRDYRNSIKDAQCRVLGATSFRRRDLEPGAPAPRVWRPRPLSAHVGLRSPDAPPPPAAVASPSPHTPRERHSVTPADGDDPGRPVPARRGPRRRLTAEQKKRSYSEPERMNEVGIADDAERPPRGPDGSVADRRRVFERDGAAWPARSLTGPELKQLQQSALADYIQRKTGRRPAAPDGPGLAPAASLCSLLREPRREPPAPRDRSSSFAGGRFIRDWRRELPGGPQGAPRPDRSAAEPGAPWARRAAKSMSAEDLLERSDTLAVPVHVRSRSSPIAEKKRQDTLLGESNGFGFVKDPCRLAEYRSRSLGGADRGQEEMPVFRRRGGSGDGLLDQPRHARPLPTGMPGHGADPRAVPCSPSAEEPPPPYTPASSHRSNGHGLAQPPCPEQGVPAARRRVSLPQRPPPSRVKWAPAVSLPEEPDTPGGPARAPGRVSLRISESGLQASPPPREDYEDEVFAGDSHPNATSSPTFETLPPPPPPPPPLPPLSQEALDGSVEVEDFPPPPPQALLEAPPDCEDYLEPRSSSSTFAKVTVAKERPVPGTAHVAGAQTLPSRSQASAEGSEAPEASSLDFVPPRDSPAGPQPSPGSGPAVQSRNLGPQPAAGIENLEENASPAPQKSSEDIRTEVLAKEIVHQDRSLADILDPDSRMKTTMDLMEGLFPRDSQLLKENGVKRKTVQGTAGRPGYEGKRSPLAAGCVQGKRLSPVPLSPRPRSQDKEAGGVLLDCPTYYSVSAQKAELLSMIRDMPEEANEDDEQADVNEKKAELIGSLTHKLESLQEAKRSLLTDIQLNNALGEEVEALISQRCKPNEFDKYKMFIGDLDKVVNLLLSLSGRLARVENVLSSLGDDASNEERNSLNEKRKVLAGQHEDARELKENLDRRERLVWAILASYLSEEQLLDYQHFVKMKSTLLIEQRKLDDKIKLGQEQVKCLLESLPSDFTPRAGGPTLPASRQAAPSEGSVPGGPPAAAATPL
ncbi:protein Shroom3 isoform X2 [Sorex araneus]|uniref:protein Shroom3 isoform X2 n=1 Tax=Sorex araneus TaxID=42254 RepID=UPI0024336CB2|nr:protein Shroom3 isoform X2 [Sorex araneus]